jgi:PBP1b-binding outer membrane lipoprotein LpoB
MIAAALLGLTVMLAGCSKNEAATEKCKDSQECAECCKKEGASGHASGTVNGKYSCKCLGGG